MGVPVFKTAGDEADPAVLLVHGYPESSHMWMPALEALAARGLYAVAPDLAGFGDSPPDPPATWERHVETLEELRSPLGLARVALVATTGAASSACAGPATTPTRCGRSSP